MRRKALLGAAALAILACSPEGGDGPRAAAVAAEPGAQGGAADPRVQGATGEPGDAERQELERSRTTAIVRAAARVAPAVVSVNVLRTERIRPRSLWEEFFLPPGASRRTPGLGSGFIMDDRGHVLTNDHVVRNAERIQVTLPDGRDLEAELVGTDEVTDVAVLRVSGATEGLPVAPLGTSRGLMIGEWAVAIGNPFGNLISNAEPSVTAGVISAVGRHITPSQQDRGFYLGMVQTDASINPGNSGGPLVNALGEVIGVNSSIFTRGGGSEGLGFAIPIDRALRIAEDLIEHGEVRRAWLGLDVEPVEADPWGRSRGVRVSRVVGGSPAAEASLRAGARLLAANERRLAAPLDFEAVLLDLRVGDSVTLETDGRAPVRLTAAALPSMQAERVTVLRDLQLITLTPAVRAERGILSEAGALVAAVSPQLAGQMGIREGDVILQINNQPVRNAEEAAAALRDATSRGAARLYFERGGGIVVRDLYWRR